MIMAAALRIDGEEADRLVAALARPEDRAYAAERRAPLKSLQRLVVRALLRRLLAEASDEPGRPWTFEAGPDRSPTARADGATYSVSTAHSDAFVACALAQGPAVGVDIEIHRPRRDVAALAAVLGRAERALIAAGGETAFYRVWSLREALAKASGTGFAGLIDGRDAVASVPPDRSGRVRFGGRNFDVGYRAHDAGVGLALARPAGRSPRPIDEALGAALAGL